MYEAEVEWIREDAKDTEEVKAAIWNDDDFREFIKEYGMEESLYRVSDFHKNLSTQLKDRGVTSPDHSDWAKRTISLTTKAKRRRQELRRAIRNLFDDGDEIVARVARETEKDWNG